MFDSIAQITNFVLWLKPKHLSQVFCSQDYTFVLLVDLFSLFGTELLLSFSLPLEFLAILREVLVSKS